MALFAGRATAEVRLFFVAVQFLTRIPIPSFANFEQKWLDQSVRYFPLVGLCVGLVGAAVFVGAGALLPSPIPAMLAVAAAVAVTGAFHEDGLADTFDGLGGGLTRDKRLEIMKDSRIGTYGAAALMLVLAVKIAALAALPAITGAAAFIMAHCGARLVPVIALARMVYVGLADGGKAKPLATAVTTTELVIATLGFLLPALWLLPHSALVVSVTCGSVLAVLLAVQARRLIGGYTGDVLGGMEQLFEVGFLLGAVMLLAE